MQAALQSLDQILQRAQEHEQLPVEVSPIGYGTVDEAGLVDPS